MGTRIHENSWFWRRVLTFGMIVFLCLMLGWAVIVLGDVGMASMLLTALIATHQGYMGWATTDDKNVVEKLGLDAFKAPEGQQ